MSSLWRLQNRVPIKIIVSQAHCDRVGWEQAWYLFPVALCEGPRGTVAGSNFDTTLSPPLFSMGQDRPQHWGPASPPPGTVPEGGD